MKDGQQGRINETQAKYSQDLETYAEAKRQLAMMRMHCKQCNKAVEESQLKCQQAFSEGMYGRPFKKRKTDAERQAEDRAGFREVQGAAMNNAVLMAEYAHRIRSAQQRRMPDQQRVQNSPSRPAHNQGTIPTNEREAKKEGQRRPKLKR